jgi:transcriptional regulator with XRE-family HTH domain
MLNGAAARERREQLGLTQEQLAERLGVDQGTIAHWELGTRQPRLAKLQAWADALGWPVAKLFAKKENGPKAAVS